MVGGEGGGRSSEGAAVGRVALLERVCSVSIVKHERTRMACRRARKWRRDWRAREDVVDDDVGGSQAVGGASDCGVDGDAVAQGVRDSRDVAGEGEEGGEGAKGGDGGAMGVRSGVKVLL